MENFVAIGNDELGAYVKEGDRVINKEGLTGILEYGEDGNTGEVSDILGFIRASNGIPYLVSVKGRLTEGWEKSND